ncbi:MAG: hypothetical protein H0U95_14205 [Bacteroidetes bacterium]|nr:hypothetical protein [Bacteroidota bacterium]
MKYIYILPFLIIAFSSCKKKYNCHCNTTASFTNSGNTGSYNSKTAPMNKKMTKKQATAVCADEAKNLDATYANFITNNGTSSSNGVTAHSVCSLQ